MHMSERNGFLDELIDKIIDCFKHQIDTAFDIMKVLLGIMEDKDNFEKVEIK